MIKQNDWKNFLSQIHYQLISVIKNISSTKDQVIGTVNDSLCSFQSGWCLPSEESEAPPIKLFIHNKIYHGISRFCETFFTKVGGLMYDVPYTL